MSDESVPEGHATLFDLSVQLRQIEATVSSLHNPLRSVLDEAEQISRNVANSANSSARRHESATESLESLAGINSQIVQILRNTSESTNGLFALLSCSLLLLGLILWRVW